MKTLAAQDQVVEKTEIGKNFDFEESYRIWRTNDEIFQMKYLMYGPHIQPRDSVILCQNAIDLRKLCFFLELD